MSLAAHGVELALLVSGETDVLHGVRQPLAHHLLHPHSVPAVDETVETDHSNLLGPGKYNTFIFEALPVTRVTPYLLLKQRDLTLSACLHFLTMIGLE